MAAQLDTQQTEDLIARAKAVGITEDEYKAITGWAFSFTNGYVAWNRARALERVIEERRPAARTAQPEGCYYCGVVGCDECGDVPSALGGFGRRYSY